MSKPDANGNDYPRKQKNAMKIDGAVCLLMGINRAMALAGEPEKYEVHFVIYLLTEVRILRAFFIGRALCLLYIKSFGSFEIKSVDDEKRTFKGNCKHTKPRSIQKDIMVPKGANFPLPLPLLFHHDPCANQSGM